MFGRTQNGFALIELLVALAIIGIISGGISMAISQMFTVNASTSNRETAIKQVENAIHYMSRDAVMAQSVTTNVDNFPLNLTWTNWDNSVHAVSYSVLGGGIFQRSETITINGVPGAPVITRVASNVNTGSGMTGCSWAGGVLSVKITTTVGTFRPASETREFRVSARSSSE